MGTCKRTLEVVLALLGFAAGWPVMLAIAGAVWLDSPGRVFFSQERIGRAGRRFRLYKFRKFPAAWRNAGPGVTVAYDARMTRVGRVLERTKLDELPQLWNILKGDMAFVGPRPESVRYARLFRGDYARVLDFVPGIFGPNQVAFRNEAELYPPDQDPEEYYEKVLFPAKARRDIEYFSSSTCVKDIGWVAKGLSVSLLGAVNWKRMLGLHAKILSLDVVMVAMAWMTANLMRFGGFPDSVSYHTILVGLWVLPAFTLGAMFLGGAYRHPVRQFYLGDAVRLVKSATAGWFGGFLVLLGLIDRGTSVLLGPLGWMLMIGLLLTPRVVRRMEWERIQPIKPRYDRPILVYGAGRTGAALAKCIDSFGRGSMVVGFLDDDDMLRGRQVAGLPVLGRESDIPTVWAVHKIQEIWVSFVPKAAKRERLESLCEQAGVRLEIVPEVGPFSRLSVLPRFPAGVGSVALARHPGGQDESTAALH